MRDTLMRLGILERISQNRLAQTRLSSSSEFVSSTPPLLSERGLGGEVFIRIKNLDISSNKILEIKVKNTYCELVCNSQKIK